MGRRRRKKKKKKKKKRKREKSLCQTGEPVARQSWGCI
jgi:hypothetical protein